MPIKIIGDLTKNAVEIDPVFAAKTTQGTIVLNGSGNRISIMTNRPSRYLLIDVDDNCTFEMGDRSFASDLHVHLREGAKTSIGLRTFAIEKLRLYCHEHSTIEIGDGCLIGAGVLCMTSDMHSIVDAKTQQRINPPGNIMIGNKVWIGMDALILKGTRIGDGSIVGIRSVVMGDVPEQCLMLGYPARLVKSGVTWVEPLLPLPECS